MRIVIVAEAGFIHSTLWTHLKSAGCQVTSAPPRCLLDVLTVMRRMLPHLAVLDYEIPRCNCETLVRIVREGPILARTPLIVLHHPHDRAAAERMGRWDEVRLMEKPLRVRRLLDAVIPHRGGIPMNRTG